MTRAEAIDFLEIENDFQTTDIFDSVDEKLFQLKNESLQKMAVPALLKKRVQDCKKINQALSALGLEESATEQTFGTTFTSTEPISFLEEYERAISAAKLALFNAKSASQLAFTLENIIQLQGNFNREFISIMREFGPFELLDIPSREATDTGVLLRELKSGNTENIKLLVQREAGRLLKIASLG